MRHRIKCKRKPVATQIASLDSARDTQSNPATFYRRRAEMPRTIRIGVQNRILASDEAEWLQRKRDEADRAMSAAA